MLLKGLGNKRSKPKPRIMTLALNLSSGLVVKLTHRSRRVYHFVHDYREGGSGQPVGCGSNHVCQSGWSGDSYSGSSLPPVVRAVKWEEKKTEVKESSGSVGEPAEGSLM
jgi:hypothetical protein